MTTYYMSFNDGDIFSAEPEHAGTSSTATDLIEVRMGTAGSNVTHRQVINALRRGIRWMIQAGVNGAGANLPPDRG